MEINQTVEFLKFLRGDPNSIVEINNLNKVGTLKEFWGQNNIYFCAGLKERLDKRCSDADIGLKSYFVVDIDIRENWFKKYGEVLSQEELDKHIGQIIFDIEFDDYCAIVKSGNGVHIYYAGVPREFDQKIYSLGVEYIYGEINKALPKPFHCDPACKNISRITRVPGTINPRKKLRTVDGKQEVLWDLGDYECELVFFDPKYSECFNVIESYAELQQEIIDLVKEERQKIKQNIRPKGHDGELRKSINEIPITELVEEIYGVTARDVGLDTLPFREGHKNMGAYVYKNYNIFVNTGSSLIKTQKDYFTVWELVFYEKCNSNTKETLKFFEEKFGIKGTASEKKEIASASAMMFSGLGYKYPGECFTNVFGGMKSSEVVVVSAKTNAGKTVFGLNILKENQAIGKKVAVINMEFDLDDTFRYIFLRKHGMNDNELKHAGTDLHPLPKDLTDEMEEYIQKRKSEIHIVNMPQDVDIQQVADCVMQLGEEGYSMIMIDSLSSIAGAEEIDGQAKIMKAFRNISNTTGITLVLIHHFNKTGKQIAGSQKISDLANVVVEIHSLSDGNRAFVLKKDKAHSEVKYVGAKMDGGKYTYVDIEMESGFNLETLLRG